MSVIKKILRLIFIPSYNAPLLCKIALKLYQKRCKFLALLLKNILISKYGIHLGLAAKIGDGIKLPHPQSIIIGEGVVIGNNCTIYHNVTLGTKHSLTDKQFSYPTVGDNVTIYTGTVILGGITVGNNTIIGANSFVTMDLEPNCVYAGNPIRKIKELKVQPRLYK